MKDTKVRSLVYRCVEWVRGIIDMQFPKEENEPMGSAGNFYQTFIHQKGEWIEATDGFAIMMSNAKLLYDGAFAKVRPMPDGSISTMMPYNQNGEYPDTSKVMPKGTIISECVISAKYLQLILNGLDEEESVLIRISEDTQVEFGVIGSWSGSKIGRYACVMPQKIMGNEIIEPHPSADRYPSKCGDCGEETTAVGRCIHCLSNKKVHKISGVISHLWPVDTKNKKQVTINGPITDAKLTVDGEDVFSNVSLESDESLEVDLTVDAGKNGIYFELDEEE